MMAIATRRRGVVGLGIFTLMVLAFTGTLSPFYVFIVAAIMGLVRPSDLGVRGALVATIMPHHQLIGAISISRTTMDTARIAGALSGAGLFAALGMGPAYVAIVSLYLVSTMLTLPTPSPSGFSTIRVKSSFIIRTVSSKWPTIC